MGFLVGGWTFKWVAEYDEDSTPDLLIFYIEYILPHGRRFCSAVLSFNWRVPCINKVLLSGFWSFCENPLQTYYRLSKSDFLLGELLRMMMMMMMMMMIWHPYNMTHGENVCYIELLSYSETIVEAFKYIFVNFLWFLFRLASP